MSDNPQFKRTDKAIVLALIALLKRKPFEKITVQDILEETPVTRATFYAHYRDKYEIAEKMMETFLQTRERVRKDMAVAAKPSHEILAGSFEFDQEYAKALLKIRTDQVDFRKIVASELEKEYLQGSTSPNREVEARIFAQAYVELYISFITQDPPYNSVEYAYSIYVQVAAGLLHLRDDPVTLEFLERRVARKLNQRK